MVVEIRTSQDLLNLLDNNEEFRRAARRALLTDELLELPDLVREMQQTQRLMIQQIAQLAERMDKMEERQERMEERQGRMEERQDRMEDLLARVVAQQELTVERLDRMDARMDRMDRRIGDISGRLRGWELERESVDRLLPRLAQEYDVARIKAISADATRSAVRVRAIWETRFVEAVEAGVDEGRITEDEADALERTDVVARARRRSDGAELWFAVQASITIDNNDIERAATGAGALRKMSGDAAIAVVYGRRIAVRQRDRANDLGVAVALDEEGGVTLTPGEEGGRE